MKLHLTVLSALVMAGTAAAQATASPVTDRVRGYVGVTGGLFEAFNAADGTNAWGVSTNARASSASWYGGRIYVGSLSGLTVRDAAKGTLLWIGTTGAGIASSPAIADGKIFVGANDGKLYAFSTDCPASPCSPLWTAATGGAIVSSPAVDG